MRLTSIQYQEHVGTPAEWFLKPIQLGPINLLVGKNATGKSRTLALINSFAKSISGKRKLDEADFKAIFSESQNEFKYEFKIQGGRVQYEQLFENGVSRLDRNVSGEGSINAVEAGVEQLKFKVPENELALVAKRDLIQHPFLEGLHTWAQNFRLYEFGGSMGRTNLAIFVPDGPKPDLSDTNQVVAIFRDGVKKFGDNYVEKVQSYFNRVGYDIESIGVADMPNVRMEPPIPGVAVSGIAVKERDRKDTTRNIDMSQGMFRALSCLIQIAYAEFSANASCICIDDIGEGLDFERSSKLIAVLMQVASANKIQLIMATNDRYVMNIVPLEAWSVLRREHETCEVLNYENSRELFEDFKLTGLNNFDFFREEASIAGKVA